MPRRWQRMRAERAPSEERGRPETAHLGWAVQIRRESVMSGRPAAGPGFAERLQGSELACQRMRVVLETMASRKRVQDACAELGICEQRFETIRQQAIQAGVAALEPKPAGRPPRAAEPADAADVARLRERFAELEAELKAAAVRLELAQVLPRVGRDTGKR